MRVPIADAQTNLDRLRRLFLASAALSVLFVLSFALYVYLESQLSQANERRYLSYQLADELRQSSDDLTQMVRSYVVTGDPRYRAQFREILGIRDGVMPRPEHYNRIYWDLVLPGKPRPRAFGTTGSLLGLMTQAGFQGNELDLLAQAKFHSDELTRIEFQAMQLADQSRSLSGEPAVRLRQQALALLFDNQYKLAKARIMVPIDQFYVLLEARTGKEVSLAAAAALWVRLLFLVIGCGLAWLLWQIHRYSHDVLGCSLPRLYRYISQIGDGQYEVSRSSAPPRSGTILDWLLKTEQRLIQLAERREQVQQQLIQQANTDALTGLANRRALIQRLQERRVGDDLCVVWLDLDDFKPVNDQFGHAAGDAVLIELAQRMRHWCREDYLAARVGGDEFVLLLFGRHEVADCEEALQQLLQQLNAPVLWQHKPVRVSASAGVLHVPAGWSLTVDDILRRADEAMYQAKQAGQGLLHVQSAAGRIP